MTKFVHKKFLLFSLLLIVLGMLLAVPVFAQEPTATPNSPEWLIFDKVRTAIEEEKGVSLRPLVLRWEYQQEAWDRPNANRADRAFGIDNCNDDVHVADARRVFWGYSVKITAFNGAVYEGRISLDLRDVSVCTEVGTYQPAVPQANEPAPDPEATQEPGAEGNTPVVENTAPVASTAPTSGFQLGGHVEGLSPQAINAMNSARMTYVKKQLPISAGLGVGQAFINDAHANGFKILLGVVGDKNALATDPNYRTQFSNFLAQLATAGADAIEVHNEPNIDREWATGQISGANYAVLLQEAYNAIKAANPGTIVISGAPAPTGFFGAAGCTAQGCNDDVFMQQLAAAGGANYMDCLGLHYNEGIVPPTQGSGDPRGEFPTYYFGSMTARGASLFPGKPVCYTELGYLSAEGMGTGLPGAFAWAGNVTLNDHAAWLGQAVTQARSRGDILIMIIWNVNFTRWDTDPMGGYAMIRPDGSCPACGTLGAAMA